MIFGGLFFKELTNEDLATEQELPPVLSVGCGQTHLKRGSFPQHRKKKVIRGHCTITTTLSETQSLGDKKQENTVTNFVQSSVY